MNMTVTALAHIDTSSLTTLGLVGLTVGLVARPAGRSLRRPRNWSDLLRWIIGFALAFQVFHFAEHGLQLGYWFIHPDAAPWLTPWAGAGRDVLAVASDGQAGSGNELLHLIGNGVFLVGLLLATRLDDSESISRRHLRLAIWVQGLHMVEHVALTATWFITGRSIGLTTGFGLLPPAGGVGGSVRVWSHFLINLVATVYAVKAAQPSMWRRSLSEQATRFESLPDPADSIHATEVC